MTNTEDDDWEYEYDENETEDFFVPLDLSNIPDAQVPMVSQGRPGHPTLLKSRLRALNAARGQPAEIDLHSTDGQEMATMGEVQIIGLHTPNPLVMYNEKLLSCQWTAIIGTDMFFVKPTANSGTISSSLRSLPSVDLLSLGSVKLVAKLGRLRPCDDLIYGTSDSQPATESTTVTKDIPRTSITLIQITAQGTQSTAGEVHSPQTGFLVRLNQAKLTRGESSRLAVSKTSNGFRLVSEEVADESVAASGGTSPISADTVMEGA